MSVIIDNVEKESAAFKSGIRTNHTLLQINGCDINDGLDFSFYITDTNVTLCLYDSTGTEYSCSFVKEEQDQLGISFSTFLIDEEKSCKNGCIFCFIDQLPAGMRKTLYFKDDDSRLSFLHGNYVTLTNLTEKDIDRIIEMHISPINISVHTTDPSLRVKMMRNKNAGKALEYLPRLVNAGIALNAQIVLCPGINDGENYEKTLGDLYGYTPCLRSICAVPVGITKFRDKLFPLRTFTKDEAADIIAITDKYARKSLLKNGSSIFYVSDELYIKSGKALPGHEYYEEYYQLENGVGMISLFTHEFKTALELCDTESTARSVTVVTGELAAPFIKALAGEAQAKIPGLNITVIPVKNRFFGPEITVSGLVCGSDIMSVKGLLRGSEVLFPASMLRSERDRFLDDVTPEQIENKLGICMRPVETDGFMFLDALLGIYEE